ncbi:MAG: SDR family NAD(P)-dependent oxidoreductase, partial [Anaerolineales bacterium]|nr:SDR family NAD(P)-dependent oxidoreductase [Anaerolineales bacterium]
LYVELGPHPTLVPALVDGLRALGVAGQALGVLRREQGVGEAVLRAVGALYGAGVAVAWPGARAAAHALPTYPFQRQRYWIAAAAPAAPTAVGAPAVPTGAHPLLGASQELATEPGTSIWTRALTPAALPELADHQVDGLAVLPGAAYIEMLLAAGAARGVGAALTGVTFAQLLALPPDAVREMQTVLTKQGPTATVQVLSRPAGEHGPWTRHAHGTVQAADAAPPARLSLAAIQARCAESVNLAAFYEQLAAHGLVYGPSYRRFTALVRRDGEALGQLAPPPANGVALPPYLLPPAMLDACLQTLGAALPPNQADAPGALVLPVAVDHLQLFGPPETAAWAYSRLDPEQPGGAAALSGDVFLLDAAGGVIVAARGCRLQRLAPAARSTAQSDDWLYALAWEPLPLAPAPDHPPRAPGSWLIFAAAGAQPGAGLAAHLAARAERCVVVSSGSYFAQLAPDHYQLDPQAADGFRRLLREALPSSAPPCRGIVYQWGLDIPPVDLVAAPTAASLPAYAGLLHLAQALAQSGWRDAPRFWVVSRGAQAVGSPARHVNPGQAPLWGLARTLALEHPELACTCVDLDPDASADAPEVLGGLLWDADAEEQVALRAGERFVARLLPWLPNAPASHPPPTAPAGEQSFRLEMDTPGILDGLTLRAMPRRAPGPGEVEIAVEAAGLNFLDVLGALGARPDAVDGPLALGGECAGRVTAVGQGVTDLHIGDAVIALAPWSFATHVTTRALLAVPKPPRLTFAEAASVPVVFLTAYYALHEIGRLQPGERVLIHSAAGGTGLAALQLAQRAGAEVFATAGSEAKRDLLGQLGVAHVADSRSLGFAEAFRAATGGQGVDVVLNSLAGPALEHSLALLAPYGRFLEIGKKDIYQNTALGLAPFRRNLSYAAIDLARLIVERPEYVRRLLEEILRLFALGELRPLPLTTYPLARAGSAFHAMAQARHVGKLVLLTAERATTPIAPAVPHAAALIHPDGAYLITGGLGGLGLQLAGWLLAQGARHLVLAGRRPPAAEAEASLAALRAATPSATLQTVPLDVSDRAAVAALLQRFGGDLPPLRGVIHAAAVLADSTLLNLDLARLQAVLAPKVAGAWNLHTLTRGLPLDFFVLFSSAAGLLGSPGQANYAAANAFLDALAHHRRALGLPALSLNWGPWAEVGLAAAQANRGQRLAVQGLAGLTPAEGLAAFGRLLGQSAPQVAVMKFNLRHWRQLFPRAAGSRLLTHLPGSDPTPDAAATAAGQAMRARLLAAAPSLRQTLLETHLIQEIAQVLRLPLDQIDAATPLPTLGLDSLMALELRNRLELSLGVTLSATLIWGYPTVAALAPFLADKLGLPLQAAPVAVPRPAEPPPSGPPPMLEALSEDSAAALLAAKLAAFDQEYGDDEPA